MPASPEFLKKLKIFAELTPEELEALALASHSYAFEEGAIIAYQRDVADRLYIVREGRLFAFEVDERGIARDSRSYLPGQYFREEWLFADDTHPATVRAAANGRLVVIEGRHFRQFLEDHPEAINYLELTEDGQAAADKSRLIADQPRFTDVSLMTDELVEYWSRRTPYLLLLTALLPALIALGFFGLWAYMLYNNYFFQAGWERWATWPAFAGGLFFLGVVAFQFLDWLNDYFMITNKELVHHEFSLRTFRTQSRKIPLDQVQSVETVRPNILATILNVGTVRITTAAVSGVVYFDYIDNPDIVKNTLGRLQQQVQALDVARTQQTMRQSVEEHFQVPAMMTPVREADEPPEPSPHRLSLIGRIIRGLRSRVEEDGVIQYRKHVFVLLRETWWQVPIAFLFPILVLWVVNRGWFPAIYVCLGAFIPWAIFAGWLVWRFEDWRNDIFQLTDMYVIDVDRLPFGFGESRKQAELSNVQNVNAIRPSIIATLFNYGNVEIDVAGTDANIVFETVVGPERVQTDIFQRREQVRQQLRLREGAERRREYSILLDVYHQAQEQGRIPRRTPEPGQTVDEPEPPDAAPDTP